MYLCQGLILCLLYSLISYCLGQFPLVTFKVHWLCMYIPCLHAYRYVSTSFHFSWQRISHVRQCARDICTRYIPPSSHFHFHFHHPVLSFVFGYLKCMLGHQLIPPQAVPSMSCTPGFSHPIYVCSLACHTPHCMI